ncbi:MAG: porin family protein [bacterium]|nr:porin family protein [bacterium]
MKTHTIKNLLTICTTLLIVNTNSAQSAFRAEEPQLTHSAIIKSQSADDDIPLRGFEFGVRYMPTFSTLNLTAYDGSVIHGTATLSHGFGLMLGFNLSKHVGIVGELDYLQVSQNYVDRNLSNSLKVKYINIPVLLSLNTNKKGVVNLNVVAGPQFGYNVGSNLNTTGHESTDTLRAVVAVKQSDIGIAYGIGLELALNTAHTFRFDGGYRAFYGLVDTHSMTIANGTYNVNVDPSRKNFGFYAGLTFLF